ncbi:threonine/homoserine/homoserine lactone efflux protein [Saccharopolyspora erythraea NRRL 2338]|uniref:Lysine exporter protein (LysE/YggA) n=2 Tax=Saccharopolyspora erythraea TaxID=1836 RepID=A4FLH6_SACEN|nr:LysE family translocator [Saccharopolyspora erythraea]EQD85286.1 lysine transporter LysE [Saccharopolyspora erythraea D]PFG98542.1 threonine/homoserine/homoserine lactone efflux protein [Saccharopolyspora erythraea NRRL 2338]QRK88585.1 LysE family translocator [Saccharopolyspora erythraea]CAM04901.1 lysine exporter protein (LysE/YggA) [Saccharopolyspora erythraea NRRL 2338]
MHIAWGPYLLALVVIVLVPGPDFVVVTSSAATGARKGWLAAAGVTCGLLIHATAATLGLSALLMTVPPALVVVKAIGVVYLGYMGVQILRRSGAAQQQATADVPRSGRSVFLRGLLIDVLNPKVMLTFLTLLPQAMDPAGDPMSQAALLSAVAVGAFGLWWLLVVPSVRRLSALLADPGRRKVFERCCGGALLAMATSIAFS